MRCLWMVHLENEDKVQIKNLQPAPLLLVGGSGSHQGRLGPRLLRHVLGNPRQVKTNTQWHLRKDKYADTKINAM